jgi:hypothetical protein
MDRQVHCFQSYKLTTQATSASPQPKSHTRQPPSGRHEHSPVHQYPQYMLKLAEGGSTCSGHAQACPLVAWHSLTQKHVYRPYPSDKPVVTLLWKLF